MPSKQTTRKQRLPSPNCRIPMHVLESHFIKCYIVDLVFKNEAIRPLYGFTIWKLIYNSVAIILKSMVCINIYI